MTIQEDKLKELIEFVNMQFPGLGEVIEIQIAIRNIIKYELNQECYTIIFKGDPGTRKTMSLRISEDKNLYVYKDNFTEKSFLTNVGNVTEGQLKKMDMLPQIKGKILAVKDLTTLFSKPEEELKQTLGTLATILDGDGYSVHTGMHGGREYTGDTRFGFIGGTTSPKRYFWDAVSLIGSKILFYDMPLIPQNYFPNGNKNEKIKECNQKVQEFYEFFDKEYQVKENSIEDNKETLEYIMCLGLFLSKSRGREEEGVDKGINEVSFEEPSRNIKNLLTLAKGIALTRGQPNITNACLVPLQHVVLSSIPKSRAKIVKIFLESNHPLTINDMVYELNLDDSTIRNILEKLVNFELIKKSHAEAKSGRPPELYELKDEFKKSLILKQS